jgi:DNA-binding response OmpR family regulator
MIIVASDNPVVVDEISTILRQKGDLFTVAADETLALSAIRTDRASLLIADTSASAFDGFALCRTLRSDPAISGLPVLCIVEPTDLGVILAVLECTADAFLCRPFDAEALTATIDDLQERQGGGTTSAAVRTQYRINHEGRDYTIIADRRQLLEFLIAAFESVVRIRRGQEQMRIVYQGEIQDIGERLGSLTAERDATVTNLHEELEERSRTLAKLNAVIQAKDQAESLLKTQKENVAKELKELGEVLEATRRSDEEKGRKIATLESDLARVAAEKARADVENAATIQALEARAAAAGSDLESTWSTLAGLKDTTAGLEGMVSSLKAELGGEKEKVRSLVSDLETAVRARDTLQQDCRQLEESLRQLSAATEAKEEDAKATHDQLNAEIRSVRADLEKNLCQLEREVEARTGLEKQIESGQKERDTLVQVIDGRERQLAEAAAQLAAEQELRVRMQAECDAVAAERERVQDVLEATYRELAAAQEALTLLKQDQTAAAPASGEAARLEEVLDRISAELQKAQADGRLEAQKRADAEAKHEALLEKYATCQQFLDTASRDLGVLNAVLEQEREKSVATENRLRLKEQESLEKDRAIMTLRSELDTKKAKSSPADPPLAVSTEPVVSLEPDQIPFPEAALEPAVPAAPVLSAPETVSPALPEPAAEPAIQLPLPKSDEGTIRSGQGAGSPEEQRDMGGKKAQVVSPLLQETGTASPSVPSRVPVPDMAISRDRWLDITKWAHHTDAVTEEQRKDLIASLIRLSKLVQKGRHLTNRQEQEIRALVARVQSLGYRFI